VLVNTGEYRALGGHPDGGDWPVTLRDGDRLLGTPVHLRDLALSTSAPLGTAFDAEGQVGHILHPATGRPCAPTWRLISVTGPSAALADALSTAMCLMTRTEVESVLGSFPGYRLAHLG
jgi:thiamine biosynthesis lipoprotein